MTLHLIYASKFLKAAKRLSPPLQERLDLLLALFREQPFSPQLHTKALNGRLAGRCSFRLSRDYRVLFRMLNPRTALLITVAHRSEVYR